MFSHHIFRPLCLSALATAMLLTPMHDASARNKPCKRIKHADDQVLRQAKVFDLRRNTTGNVDFYTTNTGIFGLNVDANTGGGFWPRGLNNQYIFGGGVWFGALKQVDTEFNKLVVMTFNPNSGLSNMVPGRIADGSTVDVSADAANRYGVYFSTDYNAEGTAIDGGPMANWPVWHTLPDETPGEAGYAGDYVADPAQRSITVYPKGPVMYSDEDIVSIYKDTDLRYYEGGEVKAQQSGYPLQTEIVQTLYTWSEGDLKDVVIMNYELTNRSQDTLRECWFAPAMDFDMSNPPNSPQGSGNDRARFYHEDPTLDLALQWTQTDRGEAGKGFGYVGMSFLSSPAVDMEQFLRTDKLFYPREEQLGLATYRNWVIENDPTDDDARYDFMSLQARDGDNGPGDKRFLMATGPFNLLPGQEVKIAVALVFARGSLGGEATGSTQDLEGLAELTRKAREKYEQSLQSGVVDVREQTTMEDGLAINSVYPNPASSLSRLEFSLGATADVAIDVVDVTGRIVLSQRKPLPAGTHVVDIRAHDLQPGVYTCRVSAHGIVKSVLLSVVR